MDNNAAPQHARLVAALTQLAVQITEQGRYQCFVYYLGHVQSIEVRVHPTTDAWAQCPPDSEWDARVYLDRDWPGGRTKADVVAELTIMTNQLERFLQEGTANGE